MKRRREGRRAGSPPPAPRIRATIEIESIAAGGEGVGHLPDGRVVFVHRTAPGDVADVRITQARDRWARGELVRLETPSEVRRDAPCSYYQRCGGCTLEHLVYSAQLAAKSRIVADSLTRIGRLPVTDVEVVPSPTEFRYRNRVSFSLRRLGGGRVVAGFRGLGAPDDIVDMGGACLLPEESIARVWDHLRRSWGVDARLLPSGEELRLTLRASAEGSVSLLVEGGYAPGRPEELMERVPDLVAVWHAPEGRSAALIAGTGLVESWADESLEISGAAFLQVNRAAAEALERYVGDLAGDVTGMRVVDAYCGVGLHARRLARAGATVVGIELDSDAVAAAVRAAIPGATFLHGKVEDRLPEALPADLVVLNPPRGGLDAEVVNELRRQPPARVLYVSCNPATLGRDLSRLSPLFGLHSVRSFDLFPQTSHVETVVELRAATNAVGTELPVSASAQDGPA